MLTPGLGGAARRGLQPPRARSGTTCPSSGRTSPTRTTRRGARRVNFDGPGSDEVRAVLHRQRLPVAARLPRRRPAPRRRARPRRRIGRALPRAAEPREVDELSAHLGPDAGADRGERPQRPALVRAARGRRLRPRRPVERRLPPRAARRAHRRARRLLRGLRRPGGPGPGADARVRVRRAVLAVAPARCTAGPSGAAGGHRFVVLRPEPRPGRQPRRRRAARPPRRPARPARWPPALVLLAPFVPMLFQGEEWAASTPVPVLRRLSDPELAEAVREGRRAEFAAFGWARGGPRSRWPGTFAQSRLRWDERAAASTPRCSRGTAS